MAEIEKPASLSATSTSSERSGHHNVPTSGVPQYGISICYHTLTPPNVAVVGGCPACRIGVLEEEFTCSGICLALIFFPFGILCCLAMRRKRCPNCGAAFG